MSSAAIDMILDAFARHGDRHYGERVSQTAHALQCAELAAREGAGDAMVAASLAQNPGYEHAIYPSLTGLPTIVPVLAGLLVGLAGGVVNGTLIAKTGIPPFIATLGMYVSARGMAIAYTRGQPVGVLSENYSAIGAGWWPVNRASAR